MTQSPPTAVETHYRTAVEPRLKLLIPAIVACGFFMESLDSTIIATSIPQMAESLGESPLRLNLAVTSYLLSLAVFIPASGWIADRFGARRVFCAAITVFTIGSALCGIATSLAMLVSMRVLQGIGGAMMNPVGRLILLRSFPKQELMRAMAFMSLPALIGPTMGPIVGGFLTTYVSWRWIFYINIPIGMLGIALALRHFEDFRAALIPRFDFLGFAIAGLGLALLELGIEYLGRSVIPAAAEAGIFAAALLVLVLYGWHATRTPNPAIDLTLFRVRTFRIGVFAGGLCRVGLGAIPFLLPLLFQVGFGLSPLQSGLLTFASSIGAFLMRTVAPWILRTFGFRRLLMGNGAVVALMAAGLALFSVETPHWLIVGYVLTLGFVRATQFIAINALSYSELPQEILSKGTGIASVAQQLSMSFGVAIGASLLQIIIGPAGTLTALDFRPVFLIIALTPLLSVLGFLRLRPQDGQQVSGHRPR
jgi:EmrB/QacA subfamily drug resistance transporter